VPAQPRGQGDFRFLNTVDVILTGEGVGQTPFGVRLRPQASLFRPSEQHSGLSVPSRPPVVAGGEGGTSAYRGKLYSFIPYLQCENVQFPTLRVPVYRYPRA